MALDSLQTQTGTKTRLHTIAITVGHRIGPENSQKYARLRTILVVGTTRKDTLNHCRSVRTPLHMIEAQDYTSLQPVQSQETLKDYNQSLETAQYSTPYFMSKGELTQATCNSLKTVQVFRLGANEQSEHI